MHQVLLSSRIRNTVLTASLMLTALGAGAEAPGHGRPSGEPGRFDYYAMALSWSPAFCATHDDPGQCASGRQAGFVMHGLWPQYEKGHPQECSTERLPPQARQKYAALYPSPKMIGHEWQKHGTCSGLNPDAYFELSARLRGQLLIPAPYQRPAAPLQTSYAEFVQAFRSANPRMAENAVLPFCSGGGRFLQEIHACYDKRGGSTACGASEIRRSANSCRKPAFMIQNVR